MEHRFKSHAILVVLAAGLGSRFGGDKQVSAVGPSGETLMEYSIYDALEAGFDRIVFVLKREMVDSVREGIGKKISERGVSVRYAIQSFEGAIPSWYRIPPERTKPFGTVHAVLSAKEEIDGPFATINADDYYGRDAFVILRRMLECLTAPTMAGMVPYVLANTMSENGGVTRGVCRLCDGFLQEVSETHDIRYGADHAIVGETGPLLPTLPVSMNIWGFHEGMLERMEQYFSKFLKSLPPEELRAECLLPIMVNDLLREGSLRVEAKASEEQWFGMTYREDRAVVAERLSTLHRAGVYPTPLFG